MVQKWIFWLKFKEHAQEYKAANDKEKARIRPIAEKVLKDEGIIRDLDFVLERFSELEFIPHIKVSIEIMDDIEECVYSYVNGMFLATIATCGILSERFTSEQLIEVDKIRQKLGKEKIRGLNQSSKTIVLYSLDKIDKQTYEDLNEIRKIRNDYIHLKKRDNANTNALKVLNLLIRIIYKHCKTDKIPKSN